MAGLLDLLMGKGEYIDPNKVLNRRMEAAGLQPAPAAQVQAPAQAPAGQPGQYSMAAIMAKINADRVAQQQLQAQQAVQQQGGQVLPQRY